MNHLNQWVFGLMFLLASLAFGHEGKVSNAGAVQVVLLAGQSNMGGAGNYNALDNALKARVTNAAKTVQISYPGEAPRPLSFYVSEFHQEKYGFAEAFGPELMIGVILAEQHPEREYLLIKTTQGGTSLYGAWNPNWSAAKADAVEQKAFKKTLKLYEKHLNHVQSNLKRLEQQNKAYQVVGMAWMQGESDTRLMESASSYEENLIELIKGYRRDLNVPTMRFVIGQINMRAAKFPQGLHLVRQAMVDVAASQPNTRLIKTAIDPLWLDYPKHDDNTHYNTVGQVRLGEAFAHALE